MLRDFWNSLLNTLFGPTGPEAGRNLESQFLPSWSPPPWVVLALLLAAAAWIGWNYYRERGAARRIVVALLAGARFLLVALVVFLLYGLMRHDYPSDLPDVVVAIDESRSMQLEEPFASAEIRRTLAARGASAELPGDTRFDRARALLLAREAEMLRRLREQYHVKVFLLGEAARPLVAEEADLETKIRAAVAESPASRLGSGLQQILEAQRGRPTAAVILLSDGITTEGPTLADTAAYARRKAIPLFTVGVGDASPPRDLRIARAHVDQPVFTGDVALFEVTLSASGFDGKPVVVRLRREGEQAVLAEARAKLGRAGETTTVRLAHRPTETGDFPFEIEVEPLAGEVDRGNNAQQVTLEVRDETLRVLLVQGYPSFEFRFLNALLGRWQKQGGAESAFDLTVLLQEADPGWADANAGAVFPVRREDLFQYDVVIFGDVDPSFLSRSVMENLADFVKVRGGGLVFLSGPKHTPLAYRGTPLAELFPVSLETASLPDPHRPLTEEGRLYPSRLGLSSPHLQLADDEAENAAVWQKLPGVFWMLDAPDVRPGARVLIEHATRTDNRGRPLPAVTLQYIGAGKVVLHHTDELWRWRFRSGDHYFGRYWVQTIRFLSRSRLAGGSGEAELTSERDTYRTGETVRLWLRFLDEKLAPAADDGAAVVLERAAGGRQRVQLQRSDLSRGDFSAALPNLEEGEYRAWLAVPALEGRPPAAQFRVEAPPGEEARLQLDSADLQLAADVSEGKYYSLAEAEKLLDDLPPGKRVRIGARPPVPVWNSFWFAALFLGLLLAEWIGRKAAGMV